MSDWRPSSGVDVAARRAELLERARRYFADNDVMSVDTPALSPNAPSDPNIEALSLRDSDLVLHTSPESFMKRLLAADYPDIYSICRVFRNGEEGRKHLPEFTMVEWYRRSMTLDAIVADTVNLIAKILDRPTLQNNVSRLNYATAFRDTVNLDPCTASIDELADVVAADRQLRASLRDDRDGWLDLIMAMRIAPEFSTGKITVIQHYPASQASLARICPDDPGVADRFEVYFGELELANGYVELTDPDELARRMDVDLQTRREKGMPEIARDDGLLAAHNAGLPDCAGVALGFERLHMIDANEDDIRNLVSFI